MGFPGENTGVSCPFLLQGIFPTQGSPTSAGRFVTIEPPGKPLSYIRTFFHCRIFSISYPQLLNANSSWVIGSVKEPLLQIFKHEWVGQGLGAFCLRLWTLEEQKRKNIRSWRKEAEWRIRGTEHLVFRISYTKLWMLYLNKEFSKIILTIRQTSR